MKIPSIVHIFIFFTVVFTCSINLFGQDTTEDDEIGVLIQEGTEFFNLGNQGAFRIAFEKFSAVLEKCRKAEITKNEAVACEALASNYLGQISLRENENEKAVDFLNQAWLAFQSIKNKDARFDNLKHQILLGLGTGYAKSGNSEKALKYFNELLALVVKKNEISGQATVLVFIGDVHRSLKQKDKALEKYRESLKMFQIEAANFPGAILFKQWEIVVLANIAELYHEYGEITECLAYNQKILDLKKNQKDLQGAVMTLNDMHMISAAAGKPAAAFRYLDEAVAISQSISDKNLEAYILSFAVSTNYAEGEVTKAIKIAEQILPIKQAQNDLPGQARLLGLIGGIYLHLGNYAKAIDYYERALPIYQSDGCHNSDARFVQSLAEYCRQGGTAVVTGLGKAFNAIGRKEDALRILEAELDKIKSDDQYKGMLLDVIGQIYFETNQNEKAIKYFSQALPLINSRNLRVKSLVITDIGKVQATSENKAEALFSYNQALLLLAPFVKNLKKGKEAAVGYTLTSLMVFYRFENPKAAIFFGKKAVDAYQRNREEIKRFDKDTQKTYLKSVEFTYRILAELLIEQNRLGEAQQLLNSFKDQQFFDFDQVGQKPFKPLLLTPRETDFISRYEKASESVSKTDLQIEELKRKTANRQPNAEETAQLQKAESESKTASDEFTAVLKQAETEFSKPSDEKDKAGEIADLREMQAILRELSTNTEKAVAVYQLVGEENFHLLLITPDNIKKVSTSVKNTILDERALEFWALLQTPFYDPTKLGQELYDTIFKPLEKELPQDVKTILWSLDGNLRYVPMAALYDGKQYLVEKYNHVNFTRTDKERMTRPVSAKWTGTGFGTTQKQTVSLLGEKTIFDALPGVEMELKEIFKFKDSETGILDGEVLKDPEFTKKNFLDALIQKRPLVHIASHFSFQPGDEARSFLLLGDGTAFTLADMKTETNLFQDVELLTLSACNTAAQQTGANGREVDGFAELAQRLGANSVMATLWSVADCSTPWLMREFYDLKLNENKNKAESLRQAQLALLNGKAEIKPCETRMDLSPIKIVIVKTPEDNKRKMDGTRTDIFYLDGQDAPPFVMDKAKPFAHPYFWSPFILFGNWK